ncbi:MAG: sugar phosphate isomerase/epimerase family protein [Planctomycetaceae bacterium]|tara:strand:+ start:1121 stop:2038 length:918 start_codon:yes stop_codon:yes gene_type:complete
MDMHMQPSRRDFLKSATAAAVATTTIPALADEKKKKKRLFKLSLAQWSLHRAIRGGKIKNEDFARVTKEEFNISCIEYVNQFFKDKAENMDYLKDLKKRADDHGVKTNLIMCDGEGRLGDPDNAKRTQAVENHYKWVLAAKFLGGHSIRVNAASAGEYNEQLELAADGLSRISEFAAKHQMNVIVENHGGLSSNGGWLAAVMKKVNMKNCGTLPDFGNFHDYDRYKGVEETMPFAKAVSAKSHNFDENGNETKTDYTKMMKIVLSHGYNGFVGIEYEGREKPEMEGIKLTKQLLLKVRNELSESA